MERKDRRDPRYNVMVDASFGSETVAGSAVRVTNLSARGCRFNSVRRMEMGTAIVLSFGDATLLEAKVRWRAGGSHGVRFVTPLDDMVVDHIRLFLSKEPALVAEREAVTA